MKKTYIAATAALLLSGSVFAETVATVNGTKIDSSELDNRVNAIVQESKDQVQDTPDLRRYVAEQIVVETVVSQKQNACVWKTMRNTKRHWLNRANWLNRKVWTNKLASNNAGLHTKIKC